MKWIKYKIVQCIIGEENILLEKKVGYSEANIAIAEIEAYNGEYTIEEDEKSYDDAPLGIEFGGTGGKTAEEARTNLGAASTASYTGTFLASGWSFDENKAVYKQEIAVNGILQTDNPFIDVYLSGISAGPALQILDSWNCIGRMFALNNSITAYCYEEKPTVDIPIILKVVR